MDQQLSTPSAQAQDVQAARRLWELSGRGSASQFSGMLTAGSPAAQLAGIGLEPVDRAVDAQS